MTTRHQNRALWISIVFFFAFLCGTRTNDFFWVDGDSPWHVWAGETMWRTGSFLFLNQSQANQQSFDWINISWAYDLWLGIINYYLGTIGVLSWVFFTSTLLLTALVVLQQARGITLAAALLTTIMAYALVSSSMTARPQLLAELLLIGYLFVWSREWGDWRKTLFLSGIALVWGNVHGSFLLLGVLAIAGWISRSIQEKALYRPLQELLPLLMIACNPYGFGVFRGAASSIVSDFGPISEWLPPSVTIKIIIALLTVMGIGITWHRSSLRRECILLFALAYLSLGSVRHLPFFAIVAALFLGYGLQSLQGFSQFPDRLCGPIISGGAALIFFAYHLLASQLNLPGIFIKKNLSGDDQRIPIQEISYLRETFIPQPVFSHYNYGGLILFLSNGEFQPFVDGRAATAFSEQRLNLYMDIIAKPELINGLAISLALIPRGPVSDELHRMSNWQLRRCGPVACVFERQNGAQQAHQPGAI